MSNQKNQFIKLFICFVLLCTLIGVYIFINPSSADNPHDSSFLYQNSNISDESQYGEYSKNISEASNTDNISGDNKSSNESLNDPLEESSDEQSEESTIPVSKPYPVSIIDETVHANYLVLYDVTAKETLYSKNGDKKCYPASITKLLTAAVALDYMELSETVTVGYEITRIGEGSSIAYLKRGDKLTIEMLVDALLLPSGNDAAYTMAYAAGCKILNNNNAGINEALAAFYEKMNQKAVAIGCIGTNFVNPDGYHDWDHYTTPNDLVKISLLALEYKAIRDSVSKIDATHTFLNGETMTWKNSNKLLSMVTYATGLKTGTTNQSGHCLSASAVINGREYIAVIIGSLSGQQKFDDAVTMFNALLS